MRRSTNAVALVALVAACRTAPLDLDSYGDAGVLLGDGGGVLADLAGGCLPQNRDAAVGDCPCGSAGLCRRATGRLSVEAQSGGGQLRIIVMDDNGCNRRDVAADQPLGTPRWAPDHERLAYITAGSQRGTLHILRVTAGGQVACHERLNLGSDLQATGVAWGGNDSLWLFSPRNRTLTRFLLPGGTDTPLPFDEIQFDAHLAGPLVAVDRRCQGVGCFSRIAHRSDAAGGPFTTLREEPTLIGPVRLSSTGEQTVYELDGFVIVPSGQVQRLPSAHSPSFALADQAIAYTTDDRQLRYYMLAGPEKGQELTIPSTWHAVFSPDWAPPPAQCQTVNTCL